MKARHFKKKNDCLMIFNGVILIDSMKIIFPTLIIMMWRLHRFQNLDNNFN